ncbi:Conserved oligomeric Golgi complex subunit 5 [Psilocybe cubensis]|uniref:Conserved oligomeric Golgi complex subunit 5 n=2 Tax=Psilocybe cubensis TaxID=181762 RepID=A0ACB8HBG4_PSICU|nr:Conserved oligomeric Golgi complex subunit 5 [Psilocybe cubensis]KAH9485273.1 Conserved oligomeric Golgi complex subunit 5 [Psilocybe cubensis]
MADYSVFANSQFDPNEYANAILAADSGSSDPKQVARGSTHLKAIQDSVAKEDISVAISKLTFGIEDVSKQIRNLVTAHHEDLLTQASNVNALSGTLVSVRAGLSDLDNSVDKLRNKVHVPYENLQTLVLRLQRLHQASDLLRRTSRFVILARRLQAQMNEIQGVKGTDKGFKDELTTATITHGKDIEDEKERAIAKAALSVAELGALLDKDNSEEDNDSTGSAPRREFVSLRSIKVISSYEAFVQDARSVITTEMENMVLNGLSTLNQTLLASSLQTAHNLGVLPTLVQSLLSDLSQAVEDRIRGTFDLNKISKDALSKETVLAANSPSTPHTYRSRVRTEPTNVTAPQWSAALWTRLEAMFQEMANCCIKVYALEKVLKLKKDTSTQLVFLDEAMQVLENTPSSSFWMSSSQALQKHFQDSSKGSSFLQQTLSTGLPRLLRLFHEFFAKVAVHTDTIYSDTFQSPETILLLRSLSTIEAQYLTRSSNKINEVVGQISSGSTRTTPGANEGMSVARIVVNELDAARFDPLLVRAVAKNIATCLDNIASRLENSVSRDRAATSLLGSSASPQQISNVNLTNFFYQTWSRLSLLSEDHMPNVFALLQPSIQNWRQAFERIVDPVATAIRRDLSAIIAKLHRIDFAKPVDPNAGMGGLSSYMKELTEKLSFIKSELIARYNIGEYGRDWVASIVKYVIRVFVLHISIACPLGESGKLQMASDMTGLEFALNAFIVDNNQNKRGNHLEAIGEEYRALRAMRPLFFLENKELASESHTAGLPPLIVLHHILVRSPIPLPHKLHGWQEAEYVRWVDEHSDSEAWTLVEGGLIHWEKISETEGKDIKDALEYAELARTVLKRVQK